MEGSSETRQPKARFDLVIIGAGLLGLSVAREMLCRHPKLKLAVVDREEGVAAHQSGHNSGVIHAGVYYKPGSLKARLCVEGARRLYDYCDSKGLPFERCGKLIVATRADEFDRLNDLEIRGHANGVPGLRRVDAEQIRAIEPHCSGLAALHSPDTGIVDFPAVARSLADDVRKAGGSILLGCEVKRVRRSGRTSVTEFEGGETSSRGVVACAGLWADRLARDSGAAADPRIVPFRGAYLQLRPQSEHLVRGLIYPVPDPSLPFLGIHLSRHISGRILLGPSALLVGSRDAYRLSRVRPRDLTDSLRWPGTWKLLRTHWRAGVNEVILAGSKRAFVKACARYIPEIEVADIEKSTAGVRAQAVARDGSLVDDFIVSEMPGSIHVRNAPSPAATTSLSLGSLVADRAEDMLELPRGRNPVEV